MFGFLSSKYDNKQKKNRDYKKLAKTKVNFKYKSVFK